MMFTNPITMECEPYTFHHTLWYYNYITDPRPILEKWSRLLCDQFRMPWNAFEDLAGLQVGGNATHTSDPCNTLGERNHETRRAILLSFPDTTTILLEVGEEATERLHGASRLLPAPR